MVRRHAVVVDRDHRPDLFPLLLGAERNAAEEAVRGDAELLDLTAVARVDDRRREQPVIGGLAGVDVPASERLQVVGGEVPVARSGQLDPALPGLAARLLAVDHDEVHLIHRALLVGRHAAPNAVLAPRDRGADDLDQGTSTPPGASSWPSSSPKRSGFCWTCAGRSLSGTE